MKEETDEDLIASARAQMLEVAIESSFQPILQLYLLFPVLMMQLSCLLNDFLRLFFVYVRTHPILVDCYIDYKPFMVIQPLPGCPEERCFGFWL